MLYFNTLLFIRYVHLIIYTQYFNENLFFGFCTCFAGMGVGVKVKWKKICFYYYYLTILFLNFELYTKKCV